MKKVECKSTFIFSAIVALVVVMIVMPLIIDALNSFKAAAGSM